MADEKPDARLRSIVAALAACDPAIPNPGMILQKCALCGSTLQGVVDVAEPYVGKNGQTVWHSSHCPWLAAQRLMVDSANNPDDK